MSVSGLLSILKPKEKKFFPLFEEAAENLVKAAVLLNKYFLISDKAEKEKIIVDIKEHEKIGDDITHRLYNELNKTFITPFDREDIDHFTTLLDEVINLINGVAQRVRLYRHSKRVRGR